MFFHVREYRSAIATEIFCLTVSLDGAYPQQDQEAVKTVTSNVDCVWEPEYGRD